MSDPKLLPGEDKPGNDTAGLLAKNKSGCSDCTNLSKKLKVSREWNKFYELKLENTDKLLHIVTEYEREKERNVNLQLAYDQRSREYSYIHEQMTNLLLEVEPLREKLRKAEKCLEEEMCNKEKAESQEHVFRFTIEQQKHQIMSMKEKVDTNLLDLLEKRLSSARSEIRRLKIDINAKTCE
ncbi:hypothetical protein Hamer_G012581 [Homarus americanus]|uniref:Uncharacterized protein n=2 Tax=Homarus americanus TaxID=6706 RepID=A0A8J5N0Q0_HOMAM|nr:hypothetical protein Hamer_G012581 [Homarus americanus]